ncbi:MAG: hypothetical protein WCW88_10670, partial [Acidithiobacillus sp.]
PKIFQLLYRVDKAPAEEARTTRCACGGKWHRADYPRKPRGWLRDFRMQDFPTTALWKAEVACYLPPVNREEIKIDEPL